MPQDSPTTPKLSVVICTYNRAPLLAAALRTLCEQHPPPLPPHEILVVDNNSTDNTRETAESFAARGPVRYVRETQQGLSCARNRGWREAAGEYVAYVDDDCRLPPEWLSVAADVIDRVAPAAFGGPYSAFYNTAKPRWYRDAYGSSIPGDEARPLGPHEYLSGGNLCIRRDILARLDGFRPALGMNGDAMGYGEETELLRRIRARDASAVVYYEPRLHVQHLVRPEKTALRWIARHHFVSGIYVYRVFRPRRIVAMTRAGVCRSAVREAAGFVGDTVRAVLLRDRSRFPYVQNCLCERAFKHLAQLGQLFERYRELRRGDAPPLDAPPAAGTATT